MDFCCAAMEQITGTVQKAEIRQAHENPGWFGAVVCSAGFGCLNLKGTLWGGFLVTTIFLPFFWNQASKDVMLEMRSHTPSRSSRDLPEFPSSRKSRLWNLQKWCAKHFKDYINGCFSYSRYSLPMIELSSNNLLVPEKYVEGNWKISAMKFHIPAVKKKFVNCFHCRFPSLIWPWAGNVKLPNSLSLGGGSTGCRAESMDRNRKSASKSLALPQKSWSQNQLSKIICKEFVPNLLYR